MLIFFPGQFRDFFKPFHHLGVILPPVREDAFCTILNPLFIVLETASALIPQRIERTITEQTVKIFRLISFVAREVFAFAVLKKTVMPGFNLDVHEFSSLNFSHSFASGVT